MTSGIALAINDDDSKSVNQIVEIMTEQEKSIVKEYIKLSDDEAERFWLVFEEYQNDQYKLRLRMVTLLKTFVDHPPPRSRKLVESIIADTIDFRVEKLENRKSYIKKFGEVLPPEKLLRFIIVVRTADVGFILNLMSENPLIE